MRKPHRILVPVDFSDCSHAALAYATELGSCLDALVDVLHVWQAPQLAPVNGTMPPLAQFARSQAGQCMDEALANVERHGVRVRGRLASGDPVETILHIAAAQDMDLIVMGRHGHGRLYHLLSGSVTEKVMRRAPCPVVSVRGELALAADQPDSAAQGGRR